jgi:hypothetical protein
MTTDQNIKTQGSFRTKSNLATPLGRRIEKLSYRSLIGYSSITILIGSVYFFIASRYGDHGTNIGNLSYPSCLYFSIVTFTSLGYGDIAPIGFGKIVAVYEVLSGLVLVALVVGKVASERQSAILLLLYTSEQQRRLQEFTKAIDSLRDQLTTHFTNHNTDLLFRCSKQSVKLLASTSSYLSFQSNQGGLANFGNISALRSLYKSVAFIQLQAINILKVKETPDNIKSKLQQLNERSVGIELGMKNFHVNDVKASNYLSHIRKQYLDFNNWMNNVAEGKQLMLHNSSMGEELLQKVFKTLPAHPWPKNVHKEVAEKLNITNKLSQKSIAELIKRNSWPDFPR